MPSVALLAKEGAKNINKLFQGEDYNTLCTVTSLRDDPEVPPAVRLAAARDVLAARPVSTRVNSTANDDARLLEAVRPRTQLSLF